MTAPPSALESERRDAIQRDMADPLGGLRERFHLPIGRDGRPKAYLAGMSLGAQPTSAAAEPADA